MSFFAGLYLKVPVKGGECSDFVYLKVPVLGEAEDSSNCPPNIGYRRALRRWLAICLDRRPKPSLKSRYEGRRQPAP